MSRGRGIRSGASAHPDTGKALREAIGRGHDKPGLVCVLVPHQRDRDEVTSVLRQSFPGATVVGCTTAGQMHWGSYQDDIVSVVSFAASECVAVAERADGMSSLSLKDGYGLGMRALGRLRAQGIEPNASSCFALTLLDARFGNEDVLMTGLRSALGDIPLFGGGASDGLAPRDVAVFHDGTFRQDCVVLVLVSLRRHFKVFSTHHYRPLPEDLIVTRTDARHRVIEQLNGRSAGEEYARVLGASMAELQQSDAWLPPMMVKVGTSYFTRGVARIDQHGFLHLACPVSPGLQLRLGETTALTESLTALEQEIREEIGEPELILGAECLMRRVEAQSTGQLAELDVWFRRNRVVGFCAYGEQYRSMHLNNSFTGIAIGPRRTVSRRDEEIARLKSENERLRRVVDAQREQVDRVMSAGSDTFGLFQNAVLLEEMVQRRTEELAEANRKLQGELARRRRTEEALRQARQEAIKANQSKTQFVAGVSHDMQQPLNAIRLLLGRLEHELLSSGGAKAMRQIDSSLQTLETMLKDFFDISKMDAGGYVVSPSTFRLGPVLQDIVREFQPQATSRNLKIKLVDSSALVQSDLVMVQRVLRNLLSNALRYTPSGRVLLGVRRESRGVRVAVIDTGIGLPEDALTDVFRPYFQINHPDVVVRRGSGFGLAVVERICTLLGVRIQVRSVLGKGSNFSILLPYGRREDLPRLSEEKPQAAIPTPLSGAHVLVVEDDRAGQEGLLALLEAWGCRAMAVGSPEEAETFLMRSDTAPDLVICDYHLGLGKTDGLQVAQQVAAQAGMVTPPVVISSDPDPSLRRDITASGALFVAKPLKPARLRATLASALQTKGAGKI